MASAVAVLALVAGASWPTAMLLAIGMFGFQISIGALNDLVDRERDGRSRSEKPIPAGHVSVRSAWAVVLLGGAVGLLVSAWFGASVLLIGAVGAGAGYAYDLTSRRAVAGPLAFALALPALLAWTWLAVTSALPPGWMLVFPLAALAGPALHLANSLADLTADRRSGTTSLATRLGRRRSRAVLVGFDMVIWTLAWLALAAIGPPSTDGLLVLLVATATAAIGATLSLWPRTAESTAGWMLAAVALALLAVTWAATAGS